MMLKKYMFLCVALFGIVNLIKPAQNPTSKIIKITSHNFLTEIIQSKTPVIIYFLQKNINQASP